MPKWQGMPIGDVIDRQLREMTQKNLFLSYSHEENMPIEF